MKINIKAKYLWIILVVIISVLIASQLYKHLSPVNTVFIKGVPFSFRDDVRKALKIEAFPNEDLFYELFSDYKTQNVTVVFKPGTPQTNAIYQLQTFEIVYKLTRYDDLNRGLFKPKKQFNAQEIDSYDNVTREDGILKIILVPPEFSNQTKTSAGGNRIWIYGKTDKELDLAVMKALLSMMNITQLQVS